MRTCTVSDNSEKSINSILDCATASSAVSPDHLQSFYDAPRELAPASLYNGMKIKLKLKLARTWLSRCEWSRLEKVGVWAYTQTLQSLRECEFEAWKLDAQGQGTTMLELLSMEIQMYEKRGNTDMVKVCGKAHLRTPTRQH